MKKNHRLIAAATKGFAIANALREQEARTARVEAKLAEMKTRITQQQ